MPSSYLNLKVIQVVDTTNPVEIQTWLATLTSANIIYCMTMQNDVYYIIYH